MEIPLITVFTPSYNRKKTLPALYRSLCNQSCFNFEWMIVDDGSQDGTDILIQSYIDSNPPFQIHYIWKENGGKASAINLGVSKIQSEFIYFMDSDDYLPSNAIKEVIPYLEDIRKNDNILGVTGMRIHKDGTPIGSLIPNTPFETNSLDFRVRYKARGDYAEIVKTNVIRYYPFPIFKGEKFCTEALVFNRMAQVYKSRYINCPLRVTEYLSGGLTDSYVSIMQQSPNSSLLYYKELFYYPVPIIEKLGALYHYWNFYRNTNKSFLEDEVLSTLLMRFCFLVIYPAKWVYKKIKLFHGK